MLHIVLELVVGYVPGPFQLLQGEAMLSVPPTNLC